MTKCAPRKFGNNFEQSQLDNICSVLDMVANTYANKNTNQHVMGKNRGLPPCKEKAHHV